MLLPYIKYKSAAVICDDCSYVNSNSNFFCTNCGFALKKELVHSPHKSLSENIDASKDENAVFVARMILYMMAFFSLLGILFLLSSVAAKYVIAIIAITLSALFFFLAQWSRRKPFAALFTAFITLIVFSAINVGSRLNALFTNIQNITSVFLCIALLVVIFKGMRSAYSLGYKTKLLS